MSKDYMAQRVYTLEAENKQLRAELHELTKVPRRSFNAFLAEAKGIRNWALARSTLRNRERYDVLLTPKRHAALEAEWRDEFVSDYQ